MGIFNVGDSGQRLSMTDSTRWRRETARDDRLEPMTVAAGKPVEESAYVANPEPEVVRQEPAAEVVDLTLRDRQRRNTRPEDDKPIEDEPRRRRVRHEPQERAELDSEAFAFTPAGPKGREAQERRPTEQPRSGMRQSARRRDEHLDPAPAQVPARRQTTEPDQRSTRVDVVHSEVEALRAEIDEMRDEMSAMREALQHQTRPAGDVKGLSVVERTMQRLSERMDRIDGGGASAQISGSDDRPRRKGGFLSSIFG